MTRRDIPGPTVSRVRPAFGRARASGGARAARLLAAAACLSLAAACGPPADGGDGPAGGDAGPDATGTSSNASVGDSARRAAVLAAVRDFKAALAAGDSAAALARLHPDAEIHESGHAETRSEYRAGHLRADMRFLGAMETETLREEVVPGDRQALYLSEYRMTGAPGGDTLRLRGVETMVLVPTGEAGGTSASDPDGDAAGAEGWQIRHIHWSSREAEGGG